MIFTGGVLGNANAIIMRGSYRAFIELLERGSYGVYNAICSQDSILNHMITWYATGIHHDFTSM